MSKATEDLLKEQREKFLSFSFATSDLLLEVNDKGSILFALGAVKKLTGYSGTKDIIGKNWFNLFENKSHIALKGLINSTKPGLRCGHIVVSIKGVKTNPENIMVSAIRMPNKSEIYIGIASENGIIDQLNSIGKQAKIHNKESFIDAAQKTLRNASEAGHDVDMTMIDLPGAQKAKNRFGKEGWSKFSKDIDTALCESSVDGGAAADLGGGKFSVLHDSDLNIDTLINKLANISKQHDPFEEGLEISTKSISASLEDMDERDTTRALFYTLNEFERKGADMNIDTLGSSFKIFVAANTQKIREFKNIVQNLDFSMHFQPIVNLKSGECSHYEMLCRFKQGDTFEWIMFGEDIGMAAEFDFAVCRRALNYIDTKRKSTKECFSINISGQSIADKNFLTKMVKAIDLHSDIKDRIILEITESTQIKDLDHVGKVVKNLQDEGLKIALDDFGAGAASFQYLSSMHVDFVKIDGKYIKNILNDQRDLVMVRNLTQMCKDLNIKVVGEFVENKKTADILLDLGIDYGQGYYFGKPTAGPDYIKPK